MATQSARLIVTRKYVLEDGTWYESVYYEDEQIKTERSEDGTYRIEARGADGITSWGQDYVLHTPNEDNDD